MPPTLAEDASVRLAAIPRVRLATLPTPLDRAERLGRRLNLDLWFKRDDLTSVGLGGNKLRKLEFILADAAAKGVDTLITTGGAQSNHARLTAAAAARLGLSCELFLKAVPIEGRAGNLLLDVLFGATVHLCGMIDYRQIDALMAQRAAELARSGRKALAIPLGGATGLGTLGYVAGFRELLDQLAGIEAGRKITLVVAGGTGSTAAGLILGASLWAPDTSIVVVSASWKNESLTGEIRRCAEESAEILRVPAPSLDRVAVEDSFVGPGYATPSEAGSAAVRITARNEGIVLDSTYTGKAMSGLVALAEAGRIGSGDAVIFLHTGGAPEIFTRDAAALGL
jgi:D-cysteine desulfhydrase family pyridoxal phosphate-dependent enzyme